MTRAARARGDRTLLVAVGEGVPLFTGLARPLNLRRHSKINVTIEI
jgi:hypothetical protein